MPRRWLTAVVMMALFTGCHHYVPATAGDLSPGSRVRIDVPTTTPLSIVTDSGPATYRSVSAVMGRVVALRGDTLVLGESYLVSAERPHGEHALRGRTSYLPDAPDRVHRRRLDGKATLFAMVPVAVIAYLVANFEPEGF